MNIPKEVRDYMSQLGKKGGQTNKLKPDVNGVPYFKWVASHKKNAKKGVI